MNRHCWLLAIGWLLALALLVPAVPAAATLDDFVGTFLGYAEVRDTGSDQVAQREPTIMIEPYKRNGLHIRWSVVDLVDGRRDVAGVSYGEDELLLVPSPNGQYLVASQPHSPFQRAERESAIMGDVVRWGLLDEDGLKVFSFVLLDDGRYELQRYLRANGEDGIRIEYQRIVDDEVTRRSEGFARRVD